MSRLSSSTSFDDASLNRGAPEGAASADATGLRAQARRTTTARSRSHRALLVVLRVAGRAIRLEAQASKSFSERQRGRTRTAA